MTHSETVSGLRLTMRFFASMFVALILFPPISYGQSVTTGLGRLYIEPLGSNLVTLLTAEIVQQRLPITMTRSEDESDCVMLWIPLGESPPSKPATKPVSKASPGKTKIRREHGDLRPPGEKHCLGTQFNHGEVRQPLPGGAEEACIEDRSRNEPKGCVLWGRAL
jgi:hypothetical protein